MDFWQLSMYQTYGSMAGVCNIVFTVAAVLLTLKLWPEAGDFVQALLMLACCAFTLIQPVVFYMQGRIQAKAMPGEMLLQLDESGICVYAGEQHSRTPWEKVQGMVRKPTLLVIVTDGGRGYLLSNRVLGIERKPAEEFIRSRLEKTKR